MSFNKLESGMASGLLAKNNFPVWERESGGYISNLCAGPKLSLAALHNLDVFGYDFGHGVQ